MDSTSPSRTSLRVPDRLTNRVFRTSDAMWSAAKTKAAADGYDLAVVMRGLLTMYLEDVPQVRRYLERYGRR